jgi:hypothetical protein
MPAGMKLTDDLVETAKAAMKLRDDGEHGLPLIRPWRLSTDHLSSETHETISCAECGCGISPDLK